MKFLKNNCADLDVASEIMKSDPQQALQICDNFLENNTENWKLHLTKIHAYNRLKSWKSSLENSNKYVQFRPDHHQPYWLRAEAEYRLGMHDEAIDDAKTAMTVDGGELLGSWPYRLMAMCHAHKGDLQNALKNAAKAQELETHDWFPPVSVFTSGTMPQFKDYLARIVAKVK